MKIMVVDDHVLFREGLVSLLADQIDFQVVGEAGTVCEAVDMALERKPDVILMEIALADGDAFEATKIILSHLPATEIIFLTTLESDEMLLRAVRYGAKGYLLKNTSKSSLVASINALGRGEAALSRTMTRKILDAFSRIERIYSDYDMIGLTFREAEVLRYLATGATNRQIAQHMGISEYTVKVYVHHLLEKLQMKNRREAGNFARRLGLVEPLAH